MSKRGFTLIEIIVVIGIVGILLSIAGPPFMAMLRRSSIEESAQRLQEAIKSAQVEAQKRGDMEFGNVTTDAGVTPGGMKRSVYLALYPLNSMIRVISWDDKNIDGLKTDNEFTVVQELFLGTGTTFSLPGAINKKACNNTAGAPAGSIVNFSASTCPPNTVSLFPDETRCIKFNGRGFSESMLNDAAYITGNNGETFAVTMSPVGLTTLCRWDGTSWLKLR